MMTRPGMKAKTRSLAQSVASRGKAAVDTRPLLARLNLISCLTPGASRENNGMCDDFVTTVKRN